MRHIIKRVILLAAALMIVAMPAVAEEGAVNRMPVQGQQSGKNECLLASRNCANEVDSIQQKIDRIKGEISRGSAVYSNDELRKLNMKLNEAVKSMEELTAGG